MVTHHILKNSRVFEDLHRVTTIQITIYTIWCYPIVTDFLFTFERADTKVLNYQASSGFDSVLSYVDWDPQLVKAVIMVPRVTLVSLKKYTITTYISYYWFVWCYTITNFNRFIAYQSITIPNCIRQTAIFNIWRNMHILFFKDFDK